MSRPRSAAVVAALALVLTGALSACGSDDPAASASPSTPPSPSPTPTPAPVIWAGEVCVARDGVTAAVGALGRNLSYDITSDRSALEQIDRQLRIQVLAVGDSLNRLGTALSDGSSTADQGIAGGSAGGDHDAGSRRRDWSTARWGAATSPRPSSTATRS